MWGYYTFGTGWELWDAPCHNQPPTHLQHEGFIDDVTCVHPRGQYCFLGALPICAVTVSSGQFTSYNLFRISVLIVVSVLPNWIIWPTAHGMFTICAPMKTVSRLAGLHFYSRIVTAGACRAKRLCLWMAVPKLPISFWIPPNHPWDC